jgi:hypothetical protein
MFNSIFWIFNLGSMVTGNLMAAYVLGTFSEQIFYFILTGLCILACLWFLLLQKPIVDVSAESWFNRKSKKLASTTDHQEIENVEKDVHGNGETKPLNMTGSNIYPDATAFDKTAEEVNEL